MIKAISAQNFTELLQSNQNLDILDIRTNIEVDTYQLDTGATHIALHEVTVDKIQTIRPDAANPLYVLCKAGPRAQKVSEYLADNGIENLIVIDGGITGCIENKAAIKTGDTPVSPDMIQSAIQESVQNFMIKIS